MGNRPYKPADKATATEINKVAKISQFELADPSPDQLTLLKRKVNEFDLLEVSNNANWQTAVSSISNSKYRRMFQGGNMDRLRFRYAVYGMDDDTLAVVLLDLDTAL